MLVSRLFVLSKRDGDAIPPCHPLGPERPFAPSLPTGFTSPSRSLVVGVVLDCLARRQRCAGRNWLFAKSAGACLAGLSSTFAMTRWHARDLAMVSAPAQPPHLPKAPTAEPTSYTVSKSITAPSPPEPRAPCPQAAAAPTQRQRTAPSTKSQDGDCPTWPMSPNRRSRGR
jgi:hypothetical protein